MRESYSLFHLYELSRYRNYGFNLENITYEITLNTNMVEPA